MPTRRCLGHVPGTRTLDPGGKRAAPPPTRPVSALGPQPARADAFQPLEETPERGLAAVTQAFGDARHRQPPMQYLAGWPTVCANNSAKAVRDMPATRASSASVQSSPGRSCMADNARARRVSVNAASRPRGCSERRTYSHTASVNSVSASLLRTACWPQRRSSPVAISRSTRCRNASPPSAARTTKQAGRASSTGLRPTVSNSISPHSNEVSALSGGSGAYGSGEEDSRWRTPVGSTTRSPRSSRSGAGRVSQPIQQPPSVTRWNWPRRMAGSRSYQCPQ